MMRPLRDGLVMPLGLRRNNPGNIRYSPRNRWVGSTRVSGPFEQFRSMAYGYRALLITLRTYMTRYRLTTIAELITRWAPPEDHNDTEAYIRFVEGKTGYRRRQELRCDKETLIALAGAISHQEIGVPPVEADIIAGYELINEK